MAINIKLLSSNLLIGTNSDYSVKLKDWKFGMNCPSLLTFHPQCSGWCSLYKYSTCTFFNPYIVFLFSLTRRRLVWMHSLINVKSQLFNGYSVSYSIFGYVFIIPAHLLLKYCIIDHWVNIALLHQTSLWLIKCSRNKNKIDKHYPFVQ